MTIKSAFRARKLRYFGLLGGGAFLALVMLSPKWMMPVFAWIAPVLLLRFFRDIPFKHGLLFGFLILFSSGLLANYESVPFPLPVFIVISVVIGLQGLIPLVLDKLLVPHVKGWVGSLVYPSASVLLDYANALGPSGVWGNLANTQVGFSIFMQWASVAGIWGVTFMIYWFASAVNDALEAYRDSRAPTSAVGVMGGVMTVIILFGAARLNSSPLDQSPAVKVAAITTKSLHLLEATYEAAFGRPIRLSEELPQSSPLVAEASKGTLAFLRSPDDPKFASVYEAFDEQLEHYFQLSEQAVASGAELLVWSEAAVLNVKENELHYIDQARAFAQRHSVYLFFPYGNNDSRGI